MKKTANDFQKLWRKAFGELPPLGYFLRKAVPERWTRFHSLPESKRYAKNDDEKAIIRDRSGSFDELFDDIVMDREQAFSLTLRTMHSSPHMTEASI